MTTEILFDETSPADVPLPIDPEVTKPAKAAADTDTKAKPVKAKPAATTESDDEATGRGGSPLSPEMRALRMAEERTLKEIIESFGESTAYKCRITRKYPQTVKDRTTNKIVQTGGFLEWIEGQAIDEAWIQEHYGGGKYELYFRKRNSKTGAWEYGGQVTVEIAGDPDLHTLPGAEPAPAPHHGTGESSTMAKAALDLMNDQLKRAEDRADRATGGSSSDRVLEMLQAQLHQRDQEIAALRAEFRESINRPPPQTSEDKFKDKFLEKLVDGDSARLTSVRTQFESEIRMIKEQGLENERRLRDSFERDRQDARNAHERELALVKSSYDSTMSAAKASYDTQLAAAKSAFDTQKEIMGAENRRLDRENGELRTEVKELRVKKDKGLPEMAKEIEAAKDILGLGDNDDKGIGDKIGDMLTNPDALTAIGKIIRGEQPPAPMGGLPPAGQAPKQRKVVRHKDGHKYILEADGSLTGPIRTPPKQVPMGPDGQPAPPPIDPGTMQQMVVLLENAYSNGTDPEIVARSAKPHITDQMLMLIRDVGGVDQFLSKVAKLPGSSPLLSTQAGRNWVRKVGKSLVGDEE